ncbi:MAG TPA: helix-turn-helix domain-containing protein [Bacteroidia bacterium]|nr:helix-turn-helix domain-containing protein [Bacteroidia bacterium]
MNTLYYNQFSSHNKHLSLNERIIIERMVGLKKSTLDIALTLGKSQRTILR